VTALSEAVARVREARAASGKPFAVILAGHNGSGKSTLWYEHLADLFRIPLVNADRMMLSILPETPKGGRLPAWAQELRDTDVSWMRVAQNGVQAFVVQAMGAGVPFAMETVFSHWVEHPDGRIESKLDLITELQAAGYFVLLVFVGLVDAQLSAARVLTRVARGGHAVAPDRLLARFPRTQKAVGRAVAVADAAILTDNSRMPAQAFTVCRVQLGHSVVDDIRDRGAPAEIIVWLDKVCPRPS
jgi:predicted ABC-type ATPase